MKHHTFPDSNIPKAYGAYSHAVVAGDFVFVAGQTARDARTGKVIEGDVASQTHRCIEIIESILGECGLTLRNVVRSTVYLSNIEHWEDMNRVYSSRFPAPFPARSTPEVKLPYGALVSIETTAFLGKASQ